MSAQEGWVDIAEVAAYVQVTKDSIYRWVYKNECPAHRVGRLLQFRRSEVDEWVKAGGDEPVPSPSGDRQRSEVRKK